MKTEPLIRLTPSVATIRTGPQLPASWEPLWTDYEIMKRSRLTPRTLKNYFETLAHFAKFLGPDVPPLEEVTRRQISAYIDTAVRTASLSTAAMRHRGLSAVLGWLSKPDEDGESMLARNPMKGLSIPKVVDEPVPVLTIDEVKRLLHTTRGLEFEDRRDTALIRTLFDTGIRRGEAVSMQVGPAWLNLRDLTALVTGKTGPRVIAFGPKTAAALHRYMRARAHRVGRDEVALWVSRSGKPLQGNGVYQALARRFEAAGIDAAKAVHVWRHTWAHTMKSAGASDGDLMSLAGWKSPAMALRYGKSAAVERARDAHRRIAPGEKV